MNQEEINEYNSLVTNIRVRYDIIEIKVNAKEDPEKIEKVVKEIEYIMSKCLKMDIDNLRRKTIMDMHNDNIKIYALLNLVKLRGWVIWQNG